MKIQNKILDKYHTENKDDIVYKEMTKICEKKIGEWNELKQEVEYKHRIYLNKILKKIK